ncbi:hypothetical protein, partial [Bifidobacterium pseudocatenulatum]
MPPDHRNLNFFSPTIGVRFIKAPPWSESTGAKGMLSHPHLFHTRKSLRGNQKQSKNVSKERMMSATEVVANM